MTNKTTNRVKAFCPSSEQWPDVQRAIEDGFGVLVSPENMGTKDHLRPTERRIVVTDENEIIGGAFAYDFQLSLPGGARIPVAGLGGVSVSPPAQGRGALRAIIKNHLQKSLSLGDAASVLMASESGLYKRFGYGMATEMAEWHCRTREFSLPEVLVADYTCRLIRDRAEAISLLAMLHEQALNSQPGGIERSDQWWQVILSDEDGSWFSRGEQFIVVVYDAALCACGYALYKIVANSSDTDTGHGRLNGLCRISEVVALTPLAEAALFKYLTSIAMTREIVFELGPVKTSVVHYMADPRQLWQRARLDMMWLRPLDLPALFCNRSYGQEGSLIIDYCDADFEQLCGAWRLTVKAGSANIERVAELDRDNNTELRVALDSAVLGEVILGGSRATDLAAVGAIHGTTESVRLFDQLMLWDCIPFNVTKF